MYRTRTVAALLRERDRFYQGELARRDEMIQSLLDRIQHPDRTPIWREAPPPLDVLEPGAFDAVVADWPGAHEWEGTEVQ